MWIAVGHFWMSCVAIGGTIAVRRLVRRFSVQSERTRQGLRKLYITLSLCVLFVVVALAGNIPRQVSFLKTPCERLEPEYTKDSFQFDMRPWLELCFQMTFTVRLFSSRCDMQSCVSCFAYPIW